MVIVAFPPGEKYAVNYTTLDQYDYGQILRIQGLKLPKTVEVHFSTQETGGTSITRIGVTKDGVTDVLIPDSVLENGDATQNYSIFAFVYITDATSGKTEYRAKLEVKARPKPEVPGGGDNPDIFREAVLEVRKSAEKAEEAQKQAEGWAHGREDLPERAEDNAKYYCGKASEDAKKTAEDRKEVERLVESVSGIDEQVTKVEELSKNAQEAATQAGTSAGQAELHKQAAETASSAAQTAAQETETDRTAVEKAKTDVESLNTQVQKNKESVDKTAQDFNLTAQQALADVNNAGQTQTERVQSAGTTAVENIENAQNTATRAVETAKTEAIKAVQTEGTTQTGNVTAEGQKQVQAVQTAAQEIIADREQIAKNATDIADLQQKKADAIVETASGTLLNVKDSSGAFFEDFSMSGKTTQDGTPTPDIPVEIVNAGRLNEDTGKYEVDAKVTGKNIVNIPDISADTPGGTILCRIVDNAVVSAQEKAVASSDVWHICFYSKDGKKQYFNGTETHKAITATPKNPIVKLEYRNVYITSGAYKGIMVEYGTVATKYEPYKEQTLTLTSDRPLTKWDRLTEQDGQIGWLYKSEIINKFDGKSNRISMGAKKGEVQHFLIEFKNTPNGNGNADIYVDKYRAVQISFTMTEFGVCCNWNDGIKYFSAPNINITNTEEFKAWLSENPLTLEYETETTEFVPLPQEQQNAIRALQTYYPTTVVSNSEDAEMQLSYVADMKNYTDRKIEEAVSAQTQNLANLLSLMPLSTQAAMIEADTNNILDNMEVQK
ncbi:hypothetical protein HMPREF0992_00138 [Lachnospiraceae bacterium 6_1_63FAA]|nr:hypothetical protein HMPREF0992_00138 [Lachnospiraceae bacterium 6_1_63FAA]